MNKGSESTRLKYALKRREYMLKGYNDASLNEPLHIKACMLYWAEGTKRPNAFDFTNCDATMHLIILQFVRKYFPQLETKIKGAINFYPSETNSYDKVVQYWSNILHIPLNQFNKPTDRSKYYTMSPGDNKYTNGIMKIRISSAELISYVYGAINYYVGKTIFTEYSQYCGNKPEDANCPHKAGQ